MIRWSEDDRGKVGAALAEHPVESGNCERLARKLLPMARHRDKLARLLRVAPKGRAPFVVPRVATNGRWYFHVTTEVTAHCVDALTGVDGTERESYLMKHWQYAQELKLEPWGEMP